MKLSLRNTFFALVAILIFATVIRFYKLGQIPHGMTWDEVAIGYNGYAVLTTRRDEWLERLPISFKSFGDYKAPLAIYLNGPFVYFFGANPSAVRLPFAINGLMAILGVYFLIYLTFEPRASKSLETIEKKRLAGLIGAFILTLMPWHVFFSRVGFESGIALNFAIWSMVLFIFASERKKRFILLILSVILAVLAIYAYHSAKIFIPLLGIILLITYQSKFKKSLKAVALSGATGVALQLPLIKDSIYGMGLERAEVSIFSQNHDVVGTINIILLQFLQHLSPNFLIFGETSNLRHGDGVWGVLLPTTLILISISIIFVLNKLRNKQKIPTYFWFYLGLVILGIIPSAIATESPHSNRSIMAIPGFIGLAITGLFWLNDWLSNLELKQIRPDSKGGTNLLAPSVIGTLACLHLFYFSSFASDYLYEYANISTDAYRDGYLEAVKISNEYLHGLNGKPKTSKIVFSEKYGQPYIYILFANKISPLDYRWGSLQSFSFVNEITTSDLEIDDALIVATKYSDLSLETATHVVYGVDGSVRFKIYYRPPLSQVVGVE